mmetsp:Transcript_43902/g.93972  ORF Transcript_43902/g.93972 Transcript_43902/m.93972 type:complete len:526 (-) Transcript_43902:715-2292(-)
MNPRSAIDSTWHEKDTTSIPSALRELSRLFEAEANESENQRYLRELARLAGERWAGRLSWRFPSRLQAESVISQIELTTNELLEAVGRYERHPQRHPNAREPRKLQALLVICRYLQRELSSYRSEGESTAADEKDLVGRAVENSAEGKSHADEKKDLSEEAVCQTARRADLALAVDDEERLRKTTGCQTEGIGGADEEFLTRGIRPRTEGEPDDEDKVRVAKVETVDHVQEYCESSSTSTGSRAHPSPTSCSAKGSSGRRAKRPISPKASTKSKQPRSMENLEEVASDLVGSLPVRREQLPPDANMKSEPSTSKKTSVSTPASASTSKATCSTKGSQSSQSLLRSQSQQEDAGACADPEAGKLSRVKLESPDTVDVASALEEHPTSTTTSALPPSLEPALRSQPESQMCSAVDAHVGAVQASDVSVPFKENPCADWQDLGTDSDDDAFVVWESDLPEGSLLSSYCPDYCLPTTMSSMKRAPAATMHEEEEEEEERKRSANGGTIELVGGTDESNEEGDERGVEDA